MSINVVNNVEAIKYADDITVIKLLPLNSDGTNVDLNDKTIKIRFRTDKAFLFQKEITEIDGKYIILRVTKEDARNMYVGNIYYEVVITSNQGDQVLPEDGFLWFKLNASADIVIRDDVAYLTLEKFTDQFKEISEDARNATDAANNAADRINSLSSGVTELETDLANATNTFEGYASRAEIAATNAEQTADFLKELDKKVKTNAVNVESYGATLDGMTNVTEQLQGALIYMANGLEYVVSGDALISKPLVISNLKNIRFTITGTLKMADDFDITEKSFIKFTNCENVVFAARVDAENKTFFPEDGSMNFPVLFQNCGNVVVDDTEIYNCMKIGGLSSSINAVNSGKANTGLTIKGLIVKNCRSAVFTQYRNNTIENVRAYDTNDAIIALNSENCLHSYINNCYGERNPAFPLVAIENTASNVVMENCTARNTRGLVELFCINNDFVNALPQRLEQIIIKDSKHLIDDNAYVYNETTPIQAISFRRGIEKHAYLKIENVQHINITDIGSSYFYFADTGINNDRVQLLEIINPVFISKSIKDFVYLINGNIKKVYIKNPITKNTNATLFGKAIRHTRAAMVIDELVIEDGYAEGFAEVLTNDTDAIKDTIYTKMKIKNLRAPNCTNLLVRTPKGTLSLSDFQVDMINKYEYFLTNTGDSRVTYERSLQAPNVGTWFRGDIAINRFSHRQYYFNGTEWVIDFLQNTGTSTGAGAPTYAPSFVGHRYLDTNNKKEYTAFGTSSASDWVLMN